MKTQKPAHLHSHYYFFLAPAVPGTLLFTSTNHTYSIIILNCLLYGMHFTFIRVNLCKNSLSWELPFFCADGKIESQAIKWLSQDHSTSSLIRLPLRSLSCLINSCYFFLIHTEYIAKTEMGTSGQKSMPQHKTDGQTLNLMVSLKLNHFDTMHSQHTIFCGGLIWPPLLGLLLRKQLKHKGQSSTHPQSQTQYPISFGFTSLTFSVVMHFSRFQGFNSGRSLRRAVPEIPNWIRWSHYAERQNCIFCRLALSRAGMQPEIQPVLHLQALASEAGLPTLRWSASFYFLRRVSNVLVEPSSSAFKEFTVE